MTHKNLKIVLLFFLLSKNFLRALFEFSVGCKQSATKVTIPRTTE